MNGRRAKQLRRLSAQLVDKDRRGRDAVHSRMKWPVWYWRKMKTTTGAVMARDGAENARYEAGSRAQIYRQLKKMHTHQRLLLARIERIAAQRRISKEARAA